MLNSKILPYLLLIVGGSLVSAQTPASVTGTLTIAGKTFKLSHVSAQERKDPFDDTKKRIRVVLSDVAVSDTVMRDDDTYYDLINGDKLHAIEFWFTADGESSGGEIMHDMTSHQFIQPLVTFDKKVFDSTTVSGKVSTKSGKGDAFSYKCTATFTAPVER